MLATLTDPTDSHSTESIRSLYNQLTPEEKQLAIAFAKSTLARTTAHPRPTPQEVHA
jgi:hypothetical protein